MFVSYIYKHGSLFFLYQEINEPLLYLTFQSCHSNAYYVGIGVLVEESYFLLHSFLQNLTRSWGHICSAEMQTKKKAPGRNASHERNPRISRTQRKVSENEPEVEKNVTDLITSSTRKKKPSKLINFFVFWK